MKISITSIMALLALAIVSLGSAQTIPDIKACVTFVYLPDPKGELVPNGTGFFISVDDTTKGLSYTYIITSKHVLWDTVAKRFVADGWLRLNRGSGDAAFVRMPMRASGADKNIFIHSDTTVDLVAVRGIPDEKKYKFQVLPFQIIRTGEDLKRLGLAEGTEVLFPALFVPHIGEHQNYPIVRFGKLALVSDGERIKWDDQFQRLHLIESISIGGHSGAPVFAWFEPRMRPGGIMTTDYTEKRIRLIGVMQGYFRYWNPLGYAKTGVAPLSEAHTGISAVVPIELLSDILLGPEATRARENE